jgi:hypothetical protein
MTVKFTNGDHIELMDASRVKSEVLPDGGIEVSVYGINGERTARHIVSETGGHFTRAYVMDGGKTIEVVKQ